MLRSALALVFTVCRGTLYVLGCFSARWMFWSKGSLLRNEPQYPTKGYTALCSTTCFVLLFYT